MSTDAESPPCFSARLYAQSVGHGPGALQRRCCPPAMLYAVDMDSSDDVTGAAGPSKPGMFSVAATTPTTFESGVLSCPMAFMFNR